MSTHRAARRPLTSLTRTRITAVLGAGLVLGLGAAATLAAWNDTEWVHAGNGTAPGIGTSTFEVQQNVTNPYSGSDSSFTQSESNPGQGLIFNVNALTLSPGSKVYAPVALRTTAGSVGGTVQLEAAVAATGITSVDPDGLLAAAVDLRVVVNSKTDPLAGVTCNPTAFVSGTIIVDGALVDVAAETQALAAAGGTIQHYCFEISLPADADAAALQGRTLSPAWKFSAVSS